MITSVRPQLVGYRHDPTVGVLHQLVSTPARSDRALISHHIEEYEEPFFRLENAVTNALRGY